MEKERERDRQTDRPTGGETGRAERERQRGRETPTPPRSLMARLFPLFRSMSSLYRVEVGRARWELTAEAPWALIPWRDRRQRYLNITSVLPTLPPSCSPTVRKSRPRKQKHRTDKTTRCDDSHPNTLVVFFHQDTDVF